MWEPQPGPQTTYVTCPVFEVLFGGARGGGKTDAELGGYALDAQDYGENGIGIMFRRSLTELVEAIERSRAIFGGIGAKFHEQQKMWRFPNKARLRFAYLENDSDADAYQGHSYSHVLVDEIGTFPSPTPIMKLMATLRSGAGVPLKFRATGNPGGPGHHWVKARYIDHAPTGGVIRDFEFTDPFTGKKVRRDRLFIPSKLKDNKHLGAEYVANLYMAGSAELVKAWLIGDWNVVQGAYFSEWATERHVIEPQALPKPWTRIRAMDWGSARPFAVLWAAVADGTWGPWERGTLIVYRELYGTGKRDGVESATTYNTGLKLPAKDVAMRILELERGEKVSGGKADPAMWREDGGPSIAEQMARVGCYWGRADNQRIPGWTEVRGRLRGDPNGELGLDGVPKPGLVVFSTCRHLIRTLPALQHDTKKPEDLDTQAEDHLGDTLRYLCMSRPWARRTEAPEETIWPDPWALPISQVIDFAEELEARRAGGKL